MQARSSKAVIRIPLPVHAHAFGLPLAVACGLIAMMLTSGGSGYLHGLIFWIVFFVTLSVEAVLVLSLGLRPVTRQQPVSNDEHDPMAFIDEESVERRRLLAALRRANLEEHGDGDSRMPL
ncbi:hypothetical protein J3D45_000674 [Microbacterium foliorum]|uniref:hypothetical protein n=1 Tax=Microbacterium foliorum TaxID=104336 RepID=UPI0020A028AE|nr:hypothetical protein [Microbacterium foliorum]MCP1428176.1 hypothetical protein [Microbacterium foliorum]